MTSRSVLLRLVERVMDRQLKCRASGLACVSLEVLGIFTAGAGPYLLKLVVDQISGHRVGAWDLAWLVAVLAAVWSMPSLLSALRSVYSGRINSRLATSLATGAVSGFLSDGVWRRIGSGKVHSLVERLPYSLNIVVDGLIWRTAPIAIQTVVGLLVILNLTSWKYVVALAAMSGAFIAISWIGMKQQAVTANVFNRSAAACGALVGDILRNPRRILSNGAVGIEVAGIKNAYSEKAAAEERVGWSLVGLSAAQWAAVGFGLTLIFLMAASDVVEGNRTVSDFVLLQAYALRMVLPLTGVGFILSQSATAVGNLAEVLALQAASKVVSTPPSPAGKRPPANVQVRELSFQYPEGRGGVSEVSVDFPPASFSVIVGQNGAGKSTLAQLLAGLLHADHGTVSYGDYGIENIPEPERHAHVLYVPQRVSLLNRDLRANLFYPPSRQSEADALRRLVAWEFQSDGQPLDLAALVGEGGEALSGGQVQKLELARLMGVNVPCLILDESTSALNPAMETRIIADFRRGMGAKTTLIFVAHRLALAEAADQVLWLERGRLKAVGSHNDIMDAWPSYRKLWTSVDGEPAI